MKTDVVLPVHGALQYTRDCVDSLLAKTPDLGRLVIVDDASDDETAAYLRTVLDRKPNALLVRSQKQRWFTRASNIGLRLVRTERAVLLNSDCVLGDGWLEELYACWDEFHARCPERKTGLVGSTLSAEEPRRWAEVVYPGYVTGHAWLCSLSALTEISAARGTHGIYLNEVDPGCAHIASDRVGCWELNKIGYATIASMKSAVTHHGGKSWGYRLDTLPHSTAQLD